MGTAAAERRANIAQTIDALPDFRAEVREGTAVLCKIQRRWWPLTTRKRVALRQDFVNYFNYANYIDYNNYSDYFNYSLLQGGQA